MAPFDAECLDHVIVLNERSLQRHLQRYIAYYHDWRTHLSLDKDAPVPRVDQPEPGVCGAERRGEAARGRDTGAITVASAFSRFRSKQRALGWPDSPHLSCNGSGPPFFSEVLARKSLGVVEDHVAEVGVHV